MEQNNFPLSQWHAENMEKTIIKYVRGLPAGATRWQVRNNKKYGKLSNILKNIDYDIKHGAKDSLVNEIFLKIRNEPLFCEFQNNKEAMTRLQDLESHWNNRQIIQ
ncbi:MAG: hypothetical protein M3162_01880 [Thermoproteota archaeon]|nr:hypothetical protein [Thermoproteota archaeon]